MQIPQVDLKAQYNGIKPEIDNAIQMVLDHTDFINGKSVEQFEKHFSEFLGTTESVGVASGTAALHLSLLACEIGSGD